jgi:ectoine hydroxylase
VPGSHKGPVHPAYRDEVTTAYPQWAIEKPAIQAYLKQSPRPAAITGGPGTAVLFHCKIVHASGHNLSPHDRWHAYMAYNPSVNRPNPVPANPRPDYVVSRNYTPLELLPSDGLRAPEPVAP